MYHRVWIVFSLVLALGLMDIDAVAIPLIDSQIWTSDRIESVSVKRIGYNQFRDMELLSTSIIRERVTLENKYLTANWVGTYWFTLEWDQPNQGLYRYQAFFRNLSELYQRTWSRFRFMEQLEERRILALLLSNFVRETQFQMEFDR